MSAIRDAINQLQRWRAQIDTAIAALEAVESEPGTEPEKPVKSVKRAPKAVKPSPRAENTARIEKLLDAETPVAEIAEIAEKVGCSTTHVYNVKKKRKNR